MGFLVNLITSRLFIACILSVILAQTAKIIIASIKHKKIDFSLLLSTGGMPSSHTSLVISLVAGIYYEQGISALAIAAGVFAAIVIHDAVTIRRAVGFQSEALNNLVKKLHIDHQKKLKELLGHNVMEVIMGAVLGLIIVYAVYHL